jgi:hypothetical protein
MKYLITDNSMDPKTAALQSLYRIGIRCDTIAQHITDKIVDDIAEMIDTGLDLDPNTGDKSHWAVADQNTRNILKNNGVVV